ncbi:hypothetical protein FHG87_023666 [Trinorchestia longiramus]|nr:hypothetical protein FHG87_023666 [Trinorchestia longiramus]
MYRVLKEDLGKKPYKMKKRHEPTEHHEKMRAERNCHILNEIAQGTLPNLLFPDENKFDIHKNMWPTKNPDLNPSDFSIWSILETRVLATLHTFVESLKAEPQRKHEAISQEQLRKRRFRIPTTTKKIQRQRGRPSVSQSLTSAATVILQKIPFGKSQRSS